MSTMNNYLQTFKMCTFYDLSCTLECLWTDLSWSSNRRGYKNAGCSHSKCCEQQRFLTHTNLDILDFFLYLNRIF